MIATAKTAEQRKAEKSSQFNGFSLSKHRGGSPVSVVGSMGAK